MKSIKTGAGESERGAAIALSCPCAVSAAKREKTSAGGERCADVVAVVEQVRVRVQKECVVWKRKTHDSKGKVGQGSERVAWWRRVTAAPSNGGSPWSVGSNKDPDKTLIGRWVEEGRGRCLEVEVVDVRRRRRCSQRSV